MEIKITKENFESEVLNAKEPVLLDFWATWCGPCQMLAPVLESFADEHDGEITVGKVNVDEEGELSAQFGVMSIPTLVLMKDGKVVKTTVGYQTKEQLESFVK